MLKIGTVEFSEDLAQLCPAPADVPPAVRATILEAISTSPETVIYSGTSTTRAIRFASGGGLGWCSPAQVTALFNLFLSRQPFTVVTDLLGERGPGKEVTFAGCFFEPGSTPLFGPHEIPSGRYRHYDLLIRIPLPPS